MIVPYVNTPVVPAPAFDASCLIPGFVAHSFSQTRCAIYEKAISDEHPASKAGAIVLAEITRCIELPFRIIEDVALAVINVAGAFFNKECQNNLSAYIWNVVVQDCITILSLPLSLAVVPLHIFSAISNSDCIKNLLKEEKDICSHLEAIRKHGYDKILFLNRCKEVQAKWVVVARGDNQPAFPFEEHTLPFGKAHEEEIKIIVNRSIAALQRIDLIVTEETNNRGGGNKWSLLEAVDKDLTKEVKNRPIDSLSS